MTRGPRARGRMFRGARNPKWNVSTVSISFHFPLSSVTFLQWSCEGPHSTRSHTVLGPAGDPRSGCYFRISSHFVTYRLSTRAARRIPTPPLERDPDLVRGFLEDAAHVPGGHAEAVAFPHDEA